MVTSRRKPILTIVEDTGQGVHDLLSLQSACSADCIITLPDRNLSCRWET